MGAKVAKALSDSQLIIAQINGIYETKVLWFVKYTKKVKKLISKFENFKLKQTPRTKNDLTNALPKLANTKATVNN